MRKISKVVSFFLLGMMTLLWGACSSGGGGPQAPGASDPSNPALLRSISGVVSDVAKTAISGATVTLTRTDGGVLGTGLTTATVTTGSDGAFQFVQLPVGTYTVTTAKAGLTFAPATYAGISTANDLYIAGINFASGIVQVGGVVTNVPVPGSGATAWRASGVTVTATPSNPANPVQTAVSDVSGTYLLPLVNGETYTLTYTLVQGGVTYVFPNTYSYTVNTSDVSLQTVPLLATPDQAPGIGSASGLITNALDGTGAPNLTLNLRPGINVTTGAIAYSTVTQSSALGGVDGTYLFSNIPAGVYTCEITGTILNPGEFIPVPVTPVFFTVVVVNGYTNPSQDNAVTGGLGAGQYRIILTWGQTPRDLDSHLTGPAATGDTTQTGNRFHIWYSHKTYAYNGASYADLDLDDTSSLGPETTTIRIQSTGTYRFSIHNFSAESPLAGCGAVVKVYKGNAVVATFNAPVTGTGNVWKVFELNGDTITPKNTLSTVTSPSAIP